MQILTFLLGEDRFAIDIALVDTIENSKQVTTVPKSKIYVTGLISNRGNVIPVINTSMILKHTAIDSIFEKLIIVNLRNEKIALAVTEIDDVLDIDNNDIQKINGDETSSIINFNSDVITLLTYNELLKI
jgi:purine-binding chemotaxis protein CheW